MKRAKSSRITVVCPAAHVAALNSATDFNIRSANWQDSTGARFAAISFVSNGSFDPSSLGLEGVEVCQAETAQELRSDHVQFVFAADGAAVLERLGLFQVLPLC
jgi:hypothetical protein